MGKSKTVRFRCGAATGAAGLAVAMAMKLAGGSLAGFLPKGPSFYLAAYVGAGAAGLALADAFGRKGRWGALTAFIAAPVVTAIGAVLAALLLLAVFDPSAGWQGVTSAAPLGLLAVTDGIGTSPVVALTWGFSLLCVHATMLQERGTSPLPLKRH